MAAAIFRSAAGNAGNFVSLIPRFAFEQTGNAAKLVAYTIAARSLWCTPQNENVHPLQQRFMDVKNCLSGLELFKKVPLVAIEAAKWYAGAQNKSDFVVNITGAFSSVVDACDFAARDAGPKGKEPFMLTTIKTINLVALFTGMYILMLRDGRALHEGYKAGLKMVNVGHAINLGRDLSYLIFSSVMLGSKIAGYVTSEGVKVPKWLSWALLTSGTVFSSAGFFHKEWPSSAAV